MSDEPLNFHLNVEAAEELELQANRARHLVEWLAAHLAASDSDSDLPELVERRHIQAAAQTVFASPDAQSSSGRIEQPRQSQSAVSPSSGPPVVGAQPSSGSTEQQGQPQSTESADWEPPAVFVSSSHEDEQFVKEVCERLSEAGISHFYSKRDILPAANWLNVIRNAILGCRVVLVILTPRFLTSPWRDREGGAAWASDKPVLTALRYVNADDWSAPFDQYQSVVVENNDQLNQLVATLQQMCDES